MKAKVKSRGQSNGCFYIFITAIGFWAALITIFFIYIK